MTAHEPKAPSPTLLEFAETKAEQGCVGLAVFVGGGAIALLVAGLAFATGIHFLIGLAIFIFVCVLLLGTFLAHDTNYMVARMRERAKERTDH